MMIIGQQLSSIFKASRLQWVQPVGAMHYRNNIVVHSDHLILSTSGKKWNEADPGDGVVCLSRTSGEQIWRFETRGDANRLALFGDVVLGGTDTGQVFALDAHTGVLKAETKLVSPMVAKPVIVSSFGQDLPVLISSSGEILTYVARQVEFASLGRIAGTFTSDLATSPDLAADGVIVVGSDDGAIYRVTVGLDGVVSDLIHTLEDRPSTLGAFRLGIRGIGSIVLEDHIAVVSYVRETSDRDPPMLALDVRTGQLLWHGRRVKSVSKNVDDYGNARVTPVVRNGMIFSTFAYNNSLHAFSLANGRGAWKVTLDEGFFQNWASPIFIGRERLLVPRVNGVVHTVDLPKQKVVDSISVEIGRYAEKEDRGWPPHSRAISQDLLKHAMPGLMLLAGIASTPIVADGLVIIGGVSGEVRAYSI
jgi:outer membrane protein assembly factor BamB